MSILHVSSHYASFCWSALTTDASSKLFWLFGNALFPTSSLPRSRPQFVCCSVSRILASSQCALCFESCFWVVCCSVECKPAYLSTARPSIVCKTSIRIFRHKVLSDGDVAKLAPWIMMMFSSVWMVVQRTSVRWSLPRLSILLNKISQMASKLISLTSCFWSLGWSTNDPFASTKPAS